MMREELKLTEDVCYNAWLNIMRNPLSCAKELDILESLIKECFNPQPYKFEDLKDGMWVWDDNLKWCFEIALCKVEIAGYESLKMFKVKNYDESLSLMIFEENRFFPITKAMYRAENTNGEKQDVVMTSVNKKLSKTISTKDGKILLTVNDVVKYINNLCIDCPFGNLMNECSGAQANKCNEYKRNLIDMTKKNIE